MKAFRLLFVALVIILVVPITGCNLIGENPLAAIASLVPQATTVDTVEATSASGEATAENTPLVRPKTVVATAKPKATTVKTVAATVKPKATVKATVTKKATVAPTKAPTNSDSSSLPIGELLFSDDFTDPSSGWAEFSSDESDQAYESGKFAITVHSVDYLAWSSAGQYYSDFVVQVEGAKASGPNDGIYGILFRVVDNMNYYAFGVNSTGSYFVAVRVDNEWINLVPLTKNSAIKTGTATNKLAVLAQGDFFQVYANGVLLDEGSDSTFAEGDIYIMASTVAVGELVVKFSSVNVWEVGDSSSPTSEPSASITKGAKLYTENFADSSSGWDEWEDELSRGGYEGGKYFIEVLEADQVSWGNTFESFDDFVIEVDSSKVAGPDDNAFGIVLRYVDVDNFYVFVASSDGYYRFAYYQDNVLTDVVPWTTSDEINMGDSNNKLSVACQGNRFILSINGTVVEDVTDDTFTSGEIGLMAYAGAEAGVKITFDNLNVWAVE
ncbi:MAG: hypothetical protein ACYCZF_15785 [Anaerolineae bacterium]